MVPNTVLVELSQVYISFAKHPDRERELEVWIGDSTILVEHTLNRLLWPRTILLQPRQISAAHISQSTNIPVTVVS